uniref:Secreted protein n=1 Tax=Trichogramma kaykai TaxID=54128 RepID=A0ABD2XAR7_9HYME
MRIFRAICASRRVTHNMPRVIVIQTLVMRTCVKITSAHVVQNVTLQQENVRRYRKDVSLAPCNVYYNNIFDSVINFQLLTLFFCK